MSHAASVLPMLGSPQPVSPVVHRRVLQGNNGGRHGVHRPVRTQEGFQWGCSGLRCRRQKRRRDT